MARILHVDDEDEWIGAVRRALGGKHQVRSVKSSDEALDLIRNSAPYDLALVDWNLGEYGDEGGREVLDALQIDSPSTRRVVITGDPPAGDVDSGMYSRFGVHAILIKGKTAVPDLQIVVNRELRRVLETGDSEALRREVPGRSLRQTQSGTAELVRKFRDWHDEVEQDFDTNIRKAQSAARQGGGTTTNIAKAALGQWLELRENFGRECTRLEELISTVHSSEELTFAEEQLDKAVGEFAEEIGNMK